MVGKVQRAALMVRQTRLAEHLQPDFEASSGQAAERAQRLADRPEHAEIAHRGAHRGRAPLENRHVPAAAGKLVRVRQPQHAGSDHDIVESRFIHL